MKKQLTIFIILFIQFLATSQNIDIKKCRENGDKAMEKKDYNTAFSNFKTLANLGDEYAIYMTGEILYYIEETNIVDDFNFFENLKRLENKGSTKASVFIGMLYYNGILGVEKNIGVAIEKFKKGELDNNPYSFFYLGTLHFNGKHLKKDIELAKKYFEKAIFYGDKKSYTPLAAIYKNSDNDKESSSILKRGCENQDSYSCSGLGRNYFEEKEIEKAIEKFNEAITIDNNPYAKFYLSLIYENKSFPFFDLDRSKKLYDEAINESEGFMLYNFAKIFLDGKLTKINYNKAKDLLAKAIEDKNPEAAYMLGTIYSEDLYGNKDLNKAIEMYKKTIEFGLVGYGNSGLGRIYYIQKKKELAIRHLKIAEENGIVEASTSIGIVYYSMKEEKISKEYLKKGCNAGDRLGCDKLKEYFKE